MQIQNIQLRSDFQNYIFESELTLPKIKVLKAFLTGRELIHLHAVIIFFSSSLLVKCNLLQSRLCR